MLSIRRCVTLASLAALAVPVSSHAATPGSLDHSFGGDGKVTTDFPPPGANREIGQAVAVQPDGKILVGGESGPTPGQSDFAIARYNRDGSLDGTFGGDGRVTTDIAGHEDQVRAIFVRPDGKIIAAGSADHGTDDHDFAIVRYTARGDLDTTFDGDSGHADGKVITPIPGDDFASDAAMDASGRIVVAGSTQVDLAGNYGTLLVRYSGATGQLDKTFDGDGPGDGIVIHDFSPYSDGAADVAVDPGSGKIALAGSTDADPDPGTYDWDVLTARLGSDGKRDSTFSGDGVATTAIGSAGANDEALAVVIQSDGKIVAGGFSGPASSTSEKLALVRYGATGSLDPSFDGDAGTGNGIVTTRAGSGTGNDWITALDVDSAGRIVAAGLSTAGTQSRFAVARYSGSDGRLDPTFDGDSGLGNGVVTTTFGAGTTFAIAQDVEIQADGKILAAGSTGGSSFRDLALARYHVDDLAPQTRITRGPRRATRDATPTFTFASSDAFSTFRCSLDTSAFVGCASPLTVGPLADGRHTFRVRAVDSGANVDATPAIRAFTVDTVRPLLRLSGKRRQRLAKSVAVSVRCSEACRASASGKVAGRTLRKATKRVAGGDKATLKLRLSKKARKAARKALAHHGKVTAKIVVVARDAAGNAAEKRRTVRLVR